MNGVPVGQKLESARNVKARGGTKKKKIIPDNERWKDVPGWEGIYMVSDHGRLKGFKVFRRGFILSNKNKNGWYLNVVLQKRKRDSFRWSVKIHKLVAMVFVPNPDNKPKINHKDSNKQNNHCLNLEWVTEQENCVHAIKHNPGMLLGMKKYNQETRPKPIIQIDGSGNIVGRFRNCWDASCSSGVCQRNIHQVASKTQHKPGKTRKQAGGYRWEYAD